MSAPDTLTRWLLPAAAYTDAAWYEREQRDLFERTWNLVAYVADLADGAPVVGTVGRERVVVRRGGGGAIEAFRHAGRPRLAGLAEPGEHDLPCAVGVWAGMVFVHLDPATAEPFQGWLGDFPTPAWVGEFPWDDLVEIGRRWIPLACNWKFYVENHVDIYHLWFLHAETLGMFDHTGLTWLSSGRHWSCAEQLRAGSERARPTLPPIAPLAADEARTLRANLLWPNVPITTSATMVNTYQVVPTGPTTCALDLRMRAMPGGVLDDDLLAQVSRILVGEDGVACEQLQRNVASPWFRVGPLARRHERPITDFHRHVLEALA